MMLVTKTGCQFLYAQTYTRFALITRRALQSRYVDAVQNHRQLAGLQL